MTNKEYIEDIIKNIEKFIEKYNDCNEYIKSQLEHYKQVLKDLERLEQINNANPSEVLSAFRSVELTLKENRFLNEGSFLIDNLNTIKQALIKAQEKDKILEIIKKWSFLDTFYWKDNDTTYDRFLCNIHTKGMKEDFEKVKEWFDGKD